jgi:hypothetical protein
MFDTLNHILHDWVNPNYLSFSVLFGFAYLTERKSPYQTIVAFSGEHEYGGAKVSEASLNGFSSRDIADRIQEDPTVS